MASFLRICWHLAFLIPSLPSPWAGECCQLELAWENLQSVAGSHALLSRFRNGQQVTPLRRLLFAFSSIQLSAEALDAMICLHPQKRAAARKAGSPAASGRGPLFDSRNQQLSQL